MCKRCKKQVALYYFEEGILYGPDQDAANEPDAYCLDCAEFLMAMAENDAQMALELGAEEL